MSQSSLVEQVQELALAGLPVRKGVRGIHRDPDTPVDKFSSDLWHSRWVHNAFQNYPIVSKCFGIRFLAEACHGMPAFVVGVGPSLDDQIKELKSANGRSLILATDAALRALLANEIEPDLVLSFDCKADQKRLWESVPRGTNIPAILNSCTHPDTIASWPGPILFFNQYHTQDELCRRILPDIFPNVGQIPSAGTVGNMALLAAHAFGCDPICAVGMDFCYQKIGSLASIGSNGISKEEKQEWRYRAQDYVWQASCSPGIPGKWEPGEIKALYDNDERLERAFMVKGENRKEFKSDPELVFYLESFNHVMPHFRVPLVNCSPDGMIPLSVTWKVGDADSPHVYRKMSVGEAVSEFCTKPLQGGRHVIKHLSKITPDPRVVS